MKHYRLKVGRIGNFLIDQYYKTEYTVLLTYKTIETSVVQRYKKIEAAFVSAFLEEDSRR